MLGGRAPRGALTHHMHQAHAGLESAHHTRGGLVEHTVSDMIKQMTLN